MSLLEVRAEYKLLENDSEVAPLFQERVNAEAFATAFNKISITANATDEAVNIGTLGDIKSIEIRLANFADTDKITLKLNGNTVADPLSPIAVYTENITSLTASNSDTANDIDILWRAINV